MLKSVLAVLLLLSLSACAPTSTVSDTYAEQQTAPTSLPGLAYPLAKSEDAGSEYIDSFIFLGESTTYHLKSRGVLSGGTQTDQVWAPKSGTLMLDLSTASCRIVYPQTGEELDLYEAVSKSRPRYILLTFGLNGATRIVSKGKDHFWECYRRLIDTLASASADTEIILQSCFPVAQSMDTAGYSISPNELNGHIDTINSWTCELARQCSLGYLNTAETLKGEDGALKEEYQVGDGYHLTREAYIIILDYIRTHAHPKEVSA